jgi:hypothetical protein
MPISKVSQQGMYAGAVLQVLQGSSSTQVINNSSTYADTGLSVAITPSSTANKVLVQASVPWVFGTNAGGGQMQFRILRDATELTSNIVFNNVSVAIIQLGGTQVISWLDSPSSTSSITYKVQFRELAISNRYGNTTVMATLNASQTGTIQAFEIAG